MSRVRGFLRNSVRGRLVFLVMAIAVPSTILVSVLVWLAYRNEHASNARHIVESARAFSVLVDHHLVRSEAVLRGLAASPDLDRGDFTSFVARGRQALTDSESWIVVADETGQQLANTRLPPGAALTRNALEGDFAAAMHAGRVYYSDVFPGPLTKRLMCFVAIPVIRDGRQKYTLSIGMRPESHATIFGA